MRETTKIGRRAMGHFRTKRKKIAAWKMMIHVNGTMNSNAITPRIGATLPKKRFPIQSQSFLQAEIPLGSSSFGKKPVTGTAMIAMGAMTTASNV